MIEPTRGRCDLAVNMGEFDLRASPASSSSPAAMGVIHPTRNVCELERRSPSTRFPLPRQTNFGYRVVGESFGKHCDDNH